MRSFYIGMNKFCIADNLDDSIKSIKKDMNC